MRRGAPIFLAQAVLASLPIRCGREVSRAVRTLGVAGALAVATRAAVIGPMSRTTKSLLSRTLSASPLVMITWMIASSRLLG